MRVSALVSFATTLLAACARPPERVRVPTYMLTADPRSLDPALSTDVPTGEVAALLYEPLVRYDVEGRLVPALAQRWETSADGLRYTFHLDPRARFHDGRPVRASDVEASFLRVLVPGAGGGRTWPLQPILGAADVLDGRTRDLAGVQALDSLTVAITLAEPFPLFLKFLAMPVASIVPADSGRDFDREPIGSGPWRFVRWAHDDRLVFARFDGYRDGPAASDSMIIRIIPEPLTQAAEYESGRLHVVEVPVGETRVWERTRPAELQRRVAIRAFYVAMNTRRGALADVRVRRALNHALPVDVILQNLMAGRGVRAAGAVPPSLPGGDAARAPYAYDVARAKALLAEAGHPDGLDLRLWRSPRAEWKKVAAAIQQELGRAGVRIEIVERDAASARAAARKGEADLFLADWYADYPDAENFLHPLFHSRNAGTGGNYAFLADPALDALLDRLRLEPDTAEAARLAREADARVFEAAPWLFLWFPMDVWAMRPEMTGWRIPAVFTGQRWTGVTVAP
jgi:peptide/nickel transport system substrate-binding protein/oligopeptide transport system substrate-binding protein